MPKRYIKEEFTLTVDPDDDDGEPDIEQGEAEDDIEPEVDDQVDDQADDQVDDEPEEEERDEKNVEEDPDRDLEENEPTGAHNEDDEEGTPPARAEKVDKGDEEIDEDDQETVHGGVVGGKKMMDQEDDDARKKRRRIAIFALLIIAFIIFLVILGIVFGLDNTDATTVFIDGPTIAPTFSPSADGTSPPSPDQTQVPAPTPTFPTVSANPCDVIRSLEIVDAEQENFKFFSFEDKLICGDTYAVDESDENRSPWSVELGRRDCEKHDIFNMNAICVEVGARLCSEPELRAGVAQGTGCGGDRSFVWTNTKCEGGGYLRYDHGFRDAKDAITECQEDLTKESVVRCCADNF